MAVPLIHSFQIITPDERLGQKKAAQVPRMHRQVPYVGGYWSIPGNVNIVSHMLLIYHAGVKHYDKKKPDAMHRVRLFI